MEEIRRQEEALNAPTPEDDQEDEADDEEMSEAELVTSEPSAPTGDTKQTTLFGGDY